MRDQDFRYGRMHHGVPIKHQPTAGTALGVAIPPTDSPKLNSMTTDAVKAKEEWARRNAKPLKWR